MTRRFTVSLPTAVMCVAAMAAPAFAQVRAPRPIAQIAAAPLAELRGIVLDEQGRPLAGAVASALGSTTAYAVSDADGRFLFRTLPYGPYLLRVHLRG
jgi:protocatechuate 3,4-dioxygenase beta subunit